MVVSCTAKSHYTKAMTSVQKIRPRTDPTPLRSLLEKDLLATSEGDPGLDTAITGVSVTTQDLEPGWAFIGVAGQRKHGAEMVDDAIGKGAAVLVTDRQGAELAKGCSLPVVVVTNTRKAAANIAASLHSADTARLTTVGVTGTNGKTTTTYLMRHLLSWLGKETALLGTNEIDTGKNRIVAERTTAEAPVLHRALAEGSQHGQSAAVVEVSSHALSLDRVTDTVFDLALMTNVQHDHLDFYENNMQLYYEAKARLFTPAHAKQGVVVVDDEWTRQLARSPQIPLQAVQVLTEDDPDIGDTPLWSVHNIFPDTAMGGTGFTLRSPSGAEIELVSPIPGRVFVQNAAAAAIGAHMLGVALEDLPAALRGVPPVEGRMQWIPSDRELLPAVLVDYAHTPEAVEPLLQDVRELTSGKVHLVFGTDGDRDASKRAPLAKVAAKGADILWVTDENPRFENAQDIRNQLLEAIAEVRPNLEDVVEVSTSRRDALRKAIQQADPQDVVIVIGKGAEPYQDVEGVLHAYHDPTVAEEIISSMAAQRSHLKGKAHNDSA